MNSGIVRNPTLWVVGLVLVGIAWLLVLMSEPVRPYLGRGDAAPSFSLPSLGGDIPVDSSQFAGGVTLVNFCATRGGLEDQLLSDVVTHERPDLEQKRVQLLVSMLTDRRQLAGIEARILNLLSDAGLASGDIKGRCFGRVVGPLIDPGHHCPRDLDIDMAPARGELRGWR